MADNASLIGIVGTGTMGSGIAQAAAMAGFSAILCGRRQESLNTALASIESSLDKLSGKGKLPESPQVVRSRISASCDLTDLTSCNLFIEAVPEDWEKKLTLFRNLALIMPADAVLATTTSSLPVTALGQSAGIGNRFIGMHFSNPPALMEMMELIPGAETTAGTVSFASEIAAMMGKVIIMSKDSPGFVFNRLLIPMINEAFEELREGVAGAEEIDTAMKVGAHHPMGPLALADLIGLDVCLAVMETLSNGFGGNRFSPSPLLREYVEKGWTGRKSGRGVYAY